MPANERRKPGRPIGSSDKLKLAQAHVAAGVKPHEALARAGYTNPKREFQRHCVALAQAANPSNELAVLVDVAQFGPVAPAIQACAVILRNVPPQQLRFNWTYSILDVSVLGFRPPGARVYELPAETEAALLALERMLYQPLLPPDDASPAAVARRVLRAIVARCGRDAAHVRAASMLLSEHLQAVESSAVRFYIPPNGRMPLSEMIESVLWIDGSGFHGDAASFMFAQHAELRLEPECAATDWSQFEQPKTLRASNARDATPQLTAGQNGY